MGKRYYLFEMVDLWMNVLESPSARTAGGQARNYLITGPGWSGKVPKGMKQISVATRYLVILGRTYADGSERDYKAVNALQAQYKLTPLSSWGKKYVYKAPPVDPNPGFSMTEKPQPAIVALGTDGYFNLMAKLMGGAAPPAPEDAPILARMAKIGIVPGQPFDSSELDEDVRDALKDLPKLALAAIEAERSSLGAMKNGWVITKGLGVYGTDYMKRAVVAAFGWPANRQEDAVYPYTEVDAEGQSLSGANNYTLTFPKDQTPPVNAFWSITMYESRPGLVVRAEPAQQVHRQPAQQAHLQQGRLAHAVLPERVAGQGQAEATGCRRRRVRSSRCCACTGPRRRARRFSTRAGFRPRW